jgi:hypothetical protein
MRSRGRSALSIVCVLVGLAGAAVALLAPEPRARPELRPLAQILQAPPLLVAGLVLAALGASLLLPAGRQPLRLVVAGIAFTTSPLLALPSPAGSATWAAAFAIGVALVVGGVAFAGLPWPFGVAVLLPFGAFAGWQLTGSVVPHSLLGFIGFGAFLTALSLVAAGLWPARGSGRLSGPAGWVGVGGLALFGLLAEIVLSTAVAEFATVLPYVLLPPVARDRNAVLPFPLVLTDGVVEGALLGAVAGAVALLARPGLRARVDGARPLRVLGALLAAAAAVLWALGAAIFEPALRATYNRVAPGPFSADAAEALGLAGKDFRWAAIVLGLGGLALLVRGTAGRLAAVGVSLVLWLTADVLWDRANLSGWPYAVVAGLLAGAILAAAALVARRVPDGPDSAVPLRLVYSAVAVGTAPMLAYADGANRNLPDGAQLAGGVLGILLVVAGVATALASRSLTWGRAVFATLVGLAAAAVLGWHYFVETTQARIIWGYEFTIPLVWYLAVTVVACLLLGLGRPTRRTGWLGLAAGLVVVPGLTTTVLKGAVRTGYFAENSLSPLTGDPAMFNGYPLAVIGALSGLTVALLALGIAGRVGHQAPPTPDEPDAARRPENVRSAELSRLWRSHPSS